LEGIFEFSDPNAESTRGGQHSIRKHPKTNLIYLLKSTPKLQSFRVPRVDHFGWDFEVGKLEWSLKSVKGDLDKAGQVFVRNLFILIHTITDLSMKVEDVGGSDFELCPNRELSFLD